MKNEHLTLFAYSEILSFWYCELNRDASRGDIHTGSGLSINPYYLEQFDFKNINSFGDMIFGNTFFAGVENVLSFMNFGAKSKFSLVDSPEMDKEKMLFYLEKQLKYEGANNVVRRGDLVMFSGNMFTFIRMRDFLRLGGKGFIRVVADGERLIVTYRLSFAWIFFAFLVLILFFTFLIVSGGNASFDAVIYMILFYGVIVGLNVFISLVSLSMFIDRTFDAFMKK